MLTIPTIPGQDTIGVYSGGFNSPSTDTVGNFYLLVNPENTRYLVSPDNINVYPSYPSVFSPLSLAPALWLDDTGSDPSVWTDMSGNGRDASQLIVGNQPDIVTGSLNGRQVRRFNGSTDFMQVTHSSDLNIQLGGSVFYVIKKSAGFRVMQKGVGTGASTNAWFCDESSNFSAAGCFTTSYTTNENIPIIFSGVYSSRIAHWKNGVKQTPINVQGGTIVSGELLPSFIGVSNTDPLEIGRRNSATTGIMTGDIAEILVFPTALSDFNRQQVEQYLDTKYNISSTFLRPDGSSIFRSDGTSRFIRP